MNKKAFTLIEILTVVILLSILVAIVVPHLSGHTDDARKSAQVGDIRVLQTLVQLYMSRTGSFPQDLTALIPEYLEFLPNDPISHAPYAYDSNTGVVSAP